MQKTIIRILSMAVVCAMAVSSIQAMPEEPTTFLENRPDSKDLPQMWSFSDDGNKNVGSYLNESVAFLKKTGWKPDKNWGYSYIGKISKNDHEIALIYDDEDTLKTNHELAQKASKKAGLPGYGYYQMGLAQFGLTYASNGVEYTFNFMFADKGKKVELRGGYISARAAYGNALEFEALNQKSSTLIQRAEKTAQKLENENKAKPIDEIAALDFMGGQKVNEQTSQNFAKIFQDEGWAQTKFKHFYTRSWPAEREANPDDEVAVGEIAGYETIYDTEEDFSFTKEEELLAYKAGKALKNIKNYPLMQGAKSYDVEGSFYYAEKKYKKGEQSYYIDFCIAYTLFWGKSGYDKSDVTNLFLLVKPGKKNAQGKLDRYFYPADTNNAIIAADIKDYYKGKEPSHCMK